MCYGEKENMDGSVNLYLEALHVSFHIFEILCVLSLGYIPCPRVNIISTICKQTNP